jgi:hypothetical protein
VEHFLQVQRLAQRQHELHLIALAQAGGHGVEGAGEGRQLVGAARRN